MKLTLTTEQIQLLDIAIICRDTKREDPEWTETYNNLLCTLAELNNMCWKGNDYTLQVEVTC